MKCKRLFRSHGLEGLVHVHNIMCDISFRYEGLVMCSNVWSRTFIKQERMYPLENLRVLIR